MKKNTPLLCLIILSTVFSSCTKEEENWQAQRDALVGQWAGKAVFTKFFEDGSTEKGEREVFASFSENRSVLLSGQSFINNTLKWYYQPEPETIILHNVDGFSISGIPSLFTVTDKNLIQQVWDTKFTEFTFDPVTSTSERIQVEETWTMVKE